MSVNGLYFFHCGVLELDKSIITYRSGMGEKIRIPIMAALVDTTDGFVLFDTGLNPKGIDDPAATWTDHIRSVIAEFGKHHDIRTQLAAAGVVPDDIRYVVNSHLHYDHTGGNQYFTKSKFVVQRAEYRFALFPDPFASGPYIRDHFDLNRELILADGDLLLLEDVYLMFTPGHTPGHQSLALKLPKLGNVILPADAIFCQENIEKNIPSANCWSAAWAMTSMQRLLHSANREKATLFITHDPNAGKTITPYPYCYR